jgi:HSP20 family protein
VQGEALTIRGSRNPEDLGEGERYLRQERPHGEFSRSVELPFLVEGEKVDASYKDGILRVELPRSKAAKPVRIQIQS